MDLAVQTILYQKLFLLFIRKLRALLVFSCAALLTDCVVFFLLFLFAAFRTKNIFLRAVETKHEKKRKALIFIFKIYFTLLYVVYEAGWLWLLARAGKLMVHLLTIGTALHSLTHSPLPSCFACTSSFSINTKIFHLIFASHYFFLHMFDLTLFVVFMTFPSSSSCPTARASGASIVFFLSLRHWSLHNLMVSRINLT